MLSLCRPYYVQVIIITKEGIIPNLLYALNKLPGWSPREERSWLWVKVGDVEEFVCVGVAMLVVVGWIGVSVCGCACLYVPSINFSFIHS